MQTHKLTIMVLLATLLIMGCGPSGPTFTIKGEIEDFKDGELYIYDLTNGKETFDTLRLKDGEFTFKGSTDEVKPYVVVFPNAVEQVIFINGGEELVYKATANDLRNYTVSGNGENELMNKFRKDTNKKNDAQTREIAKSYIEANTLSPIAIYLFDKYFVQDDNVDDKQTETILQILKKENPQNLFLLNIEGQLAKSGKGEIGSTLPSVKLETKEKKTIDISKLDKDFTIIIYWATWCNNSYDIADQIREIKDKYEESGKLDIVSVSADTEIYRWQDYTRPDSIGIHNYCDGEAWDSPILKDLSIRSLPLFIIADKDHKIVVRDENLDNMMAELGKLIKL